MTTVLSRTAKHEVLRTDSPDHGPLIVKRPVNGAPHGPIDRERRMLDRLRGLRHVPQLLPIDDATLTVVDIGAVSLTESGWCGTVGLEEFLVLARRIAEAIAEIHDRGVIHRDLNPSNIVVRPDELTLQVIDFELATSFEEHRGSGHPEQARGTPTFAAPEQTGRMNRPVDHRSDLYSLGATLYAVATGGPPFDLDEPLDLLRAVLAEMPAPPDRLATWMPGVVGDLIMRLLDKEPDDRYQTAAGVAHDLHAIGERLAGGAPDGLDGFVLGERDLPPDLRPPRRLYGRHHDARFLTSLLDEVTAGHDRVAMVTGHAGIGKTALIHELHRPVSLAAGRFITGTCDQFRRDRPFHAVGDALAELAELLATDPTTEAGAIRDRCLDAVGADAEALAAVLPEVGPMLSVTRRSRVNRAATPASAARSSGCSPRCRPPRARRCCSSTTSSGPISPPSI